MVIKDRKKEINKNKHKRYILHEFIKYDRIHVAVGPHYEVSWPIYVVLVKYLKYLLDHVKCS